MLVHFLTIVCSGIAGTQQHHKEKKMDLKAEIKKIIFPSKETVIVSENCVKFQQVMECLFEFEKRTVSSLGIALMLTYMLIIIIFITGPEIKQNSRRRNSDKSKEPLSQFISTRLPFLYCAWIRHGFVSEYL